MREKTTNSNLRDLYGTKRTVIFAGGDTQEIMDNIFYFFKAKYVPKLTDFNFLSDTFT